MASKAKEVLRATLRGPMMVQIIEFSYRNGEIIPIFHTDRLSKILEKKPSLKRYMVIDISGRTRTGKSFLANLLICQLRHLKENPADGLANWLECEEMVSGVDWKQSDFAVTEGVHMWNEPFVLGQGANEFGVLMMDCQGMCGYTDTSSTTADVLLDYWVLRLSTVHIFNVSKLIDSIDFTHLVDIINYHKLRTKTSRSMIDFNAMLVVQRDLEGNRKYGLADGFFSQQKSDGRCGKLKGQIALIESCFKSCRQFLLPLPSGAIRNASNGSAEHKISGFLDIEDQRFLQYVAELGQLLFLQLPSTDSCVFTNAAELKNNMQNMKEPYANGADIPKTGSTWHVLAWEEILGHVNHIRTNLVPKLSASIHPASDSEAEIQRKVQESLHDARNYIEESKKELGTDEPGLWENALVEVDRMYTDMESEKLRLNRNYGKLVNTGKTVGKWVGGAAGGAAGVAAGVAAGAAAGAVAGSYAAIEAVGVTGEAVGATTIGGSVVITSASAGAQLGSAVGSYITKAITKSLENDTNK